MDFITNYWVIMLILFILLLLIVLSYLIDKEIRKMSGNSRNTDLDLENKNDANSDVQDDLDSVKLNSVNYSENVLTDLDGQELDYDELDIPDIDDDFNKVIHKKKLIDSSIKDSVDALEVTAVDFKEEKKEADIVLPEIKLKKDNLENIWE